MYEVLWGEKCRKFYASKIPWRPAATMVHLSIKLWTLVAKRIRLMLGASSEKGKQRDTIEIRISLVKRRASNVLKVLIRLTEIQLKTVMEGEQRPSII